MAEEIKTVSQRLKEAEAAEVKAQAKLAPFKEKMDAIKAEEAKIKESYDAANADFKAAQKEVSNILKEAMEARKPARRPYKRKVKDEPSANGATADDGQETLPGLSGVGSFDPDEEGEAPSAEDRELVEA